ncbi:ribosomal protein S18-alanine N-acetyltransferase [Agrilactobacillus yilanensis]|uniref:Ribosomal protein S18-alanine N-acetyltransferase n=1 Tax=Agrilactobacillus yilanensis TaxID=2485997 RepID=A0ABW4J7H0_9LACO|nr:ribosomal protein S18-alanine N-acetyltransferase [Agrilactobacillus yilanensis]
MFKKFKALFQKKNDNTMMIHYEDQTLMINQRPYTLARAKYSDIDEMLVLERALYDGETPWDKMAFMSEIRKTELSLYLVLREQDELVAFIGCWFTKNESHITNIAVSQAYQNQGIGRFLMVYMINLVREQGSEQMTLEVRTNNEPAKHLYHSLGFEDGHIKVGYYVLDHADAMDMRLNLKDSAWTKENDF